MSEAKTRGVRALSSAVVVTAFVAASAFVPHARAAEQPPPPKAVAIADELAHTPERLAMLGAGTSARRSSEAAGGGGDAGTAAPVGLSACPADGIVTQNVMLQADLTCRLNVMQSGVTIDLNGFTLFGSVHEVNARGTTIRNGTIDAETVPDYYGAIWVSGALIDNITLTNARSFSAILGSGSTVRNSRFVENTGVIFDLYWGGGNTIKNNIFIRNRYVMSIQLDSNTMVDGNVFVENFVGVNLWNEVGPGVSDNMVRNNVFASNDIGVQIVAEPAYWHLPLPMMANNQFRSNVFVANRQGGFVADRVDCGSVSIPACPARNTLLEGNTFVLNGREPLVENVDDGIYINPAYNWSSNFTLRRNTALLNADLGIEAAGAVDGGRNVGLFNGDRRQCVGVRCGFGGLFGR